MWEFFFPSFSAVHSQPRTLHTLEPVLEPLILLTHRILVISKSHNRDPIPVDEYLLSQRLVNASYVLTPN